MTQHNILIVDDDPIFSSLLGDVFKQAGYAVESASSADAALETLKAGTAFDLVVTDQRMPGTTGTEFVKKLLQLRPGLPVVMVSGFLKSEDIRQLIRDGIGGVFIKPLNIFQLLKRAALLIEKSHAGATRDEKRDDADEAAEDDSQLRLLRGARGAAATRFFRQMEGLRGVSSNLVAVGAPGTDFDALAHDLADPQLDTVFPLRPSDLDDPELLASRMGGLATRSPGRLMLVLDRIGELTPERTETVFAISRCAAPFDRTGLSTRFLFCLDSDPDELFSAGRLDENLYLFMGTMELKVPALAEMTEDIPAIAQAMLDRAPGARCLLSDAAAEALKTLDWSGGILRLQSVLADAAAATEGATIDAETIRLAHGGALSVAEAAQVSDLREYLAAEAGEYVLAMSALLGDLPRVATALGLTAESTRQLIARVGKKN
jgi:two-component system response regulator PilR (NtrC family)